jgi:hypothetical protein
MRVAQFVRIFGLLLVLGLIGFVLGCSGGSDSSSPNKEIVKKIGADFKADRQQAARERGIAIKKP